MPQPDTCRGPCHRKSRRSPRRTRIRQHVPPRRRTSVPCPHLLVPPPPGLTPALIRWNRAILLRSARAGRPPASQSSARLPRITALRSQPPLPDDGCQAVVELGRDRLPRCTGRDGLGDPTQLHAGVLRDLRQELPSRPASGSRTAPSARRTPRRCPDGPLPRVRVTHPPDPAARHCRPDHCPRPQRAEDRSRAPVRRAQVDRAAGRTPSHVAGQPPPQTVDVGPHQAGRDAAGEQGGVDGLDVGPVHGHPRLQNRNTFARSRWRRVRGRRSGQVKGFVGLVVNGQGRRSGVGRCSVRRCAAPGSGGRNGGCASAWRRSVGRPVLLPAVVVRAWPRRKEAFVDWSQ
ncbi:hypothetical protein FBY22_3694 [Streptomyces sp. SLBN-31]|nr:hypothetical protein FBY22_3694 [Streptomyces sp. SLBN-31]